MTLNSRRGEEESVDSGFRVVDRVQNDRQSTKLLLRLSSADRVSEGETGWESVVVGVAIKVRT